MLIDLINEVQTACGLEPQAVTAAVAGTGQDFADCTDATGAILDVGAVSGTSPSLTVQIEESDDNATWSAIPGMVFAAVTTANQHQVVRGLRTKRYVRANAVTVTGTSPSLQTCVQIVAQKHQMQGAGVTSPGGYDPYPST